MQSTSLTVEDFAREVERIYRSAKDYLSPSFQISLEDDKFLKLSGVEGNFPLTDYAENQLASRLQIPKPYWDRCSQIPGLKSVNANFWLLNGGNTGRMIRTIDGNARAVLSDKYARIDNFPVLQAIFPVLTSAKEKYGIEIVSHALSDTKMYLQIVFPKKVGEVKVGDIIQAGVVISNSEVGAGNYDISRWTRRLRCMNGMTSESFFKKRHLGRSMLGEEDGEGIFRQDTIASELHTIALKSRDALEEAINGSWFEDEIQKMRNATSDIISKPTDTIEKTVKLLSLPDYSKDLLLANLIGEGDLSRWGLVNSVTALTHDSRFSEPDRAFQIEEYGHNILTMNSRDWAALVA